nr:hypothetical protein [Tanacetum cinerariifolium]
VVKRSGDVTRLQALVDKRKIVISEDVIREILRLDEAEGVVCLPNEEIFAGLAQMGYEKPSTKQTFYKAFFSSQWKFLIHTILQSLSAKRTSWNEFSTAMASAVIYNVDQENVTEEIADDVAQPTSPLPPSPVIPSLPPHQSPRPPPPQAAEGSSLLDEDNVFNQGRISVDIDEGIELVDDQEKDAQVKGRQADTQAEIYNLDLDHSSKVVAASTHIPAAKPAVVAVSTPISAAKPVAKLKVLKIATAAPAVSTRKRKGVVIRDPKKELHDDTPAETQSAKDKGKGILVEDPKPMKKKDQIEMDAEYVRKLQEEEESHVQAKGIQYIRRYHGYKKKPQPESEARKNMIDYPKNTKGFKMAFFKGKTYDQIRPIFQARF